MKKAIFLFTAFATSIFAENCRWETTHSLYSEHPNRIYVGPEVECFPQNNYLWEYWGVRLGYEYLKPNSIYSGLDFFSSCPGGNFNWYYSLNMRIGYTAATAKTMVTPFIGGLITHPQVLRYATGGFQSLISINARTDIGCTLTFFMPIRSYIGWYEKIAFPLIYHPTHHCDLHFEFYRSESLKRTWHNYGSRFLIGYRY
ncbi:MAG: hypothetical protein HW387_333 [Parachlamydiales bacterium]|nr:hypothetical protein [Parachlamydiales bacterium]